MTQTLTLPGVALQWKAVGPFNQAPSATVSIRPHFPFGESSVNNGSVVFPASNLSRSNASFFATPLIGVFDLNGRLLGPDGYPLVVPPLDTGSSSWIQSPTFYEVQIDLAGMSAQCGIFVAFQNAANNFGDGGEDGVLLRDNNASTSAMISNGMGAYTGTVYLSDTVVHPILVDQSVVIHYGGNFTATVNSINLLTNSMTVTTAAAQSASTSSIFYWGTSGGVNLGVDLSQFVNWIG
jgi:hypothetical protein